MKLKEKKEITEFQRYNRTVVSNDLAYMKLESQGRIKRAKNK